MVIEKLEEADSCIESALNSNSGHFFRNRMALAIDFINEAMAELKTPRWYTPEQWEAETGEAWPERNAIYFRDNNDDEYFWGLETYGILKSIYGKHKLESGEEYDAGPLPFCVCATEAGPPPDGWKPEETE
jgi:hypothetical protein